MDLALNNTQRMICQKNQTNQPNKITEASSNSSHAMGFAIQVILLGNI